MFKLEKVKGKFKQYKNLGHLKELFNENQFLGRNNDMVYLVAVINFFDFIVDHRDENCLEIHCIFVVSTKFELLPSTVLEH